MIVEGAKDIVGVHASAQKKERAQKNAANTFIFLFLELTGTKDSPKNSRVKSRKFLVGVPIY